MADVANIARRETALYDAKADTAELSANSRIENWQIRFAEMRAALRRPMRFEQAQTLFGTLAVCVALAVLNTIGLFAPVDGRIFDTVTRNEAASPPAVVIVERDNAFEQFGSDRFGQLNQRLADLKAERVGYLPEPQDFSESAEAEQRTADFAASSVLPVVVGRLAELAPATEHWQFSSATGNVASAIETARLLPETEYGVHRSQSGFIAGRDGPIPLFETALAGDDTPPNSYLVRMPEQQSIPVLTATQILRGEISDDELAEMVVLVAGDTALTPQLSTPASPNARGTSEALFRAHAIQTLRSERIAHFARPVLALLAFLALGLLIWAVCRKFDPKRIALYLPLALSGLTILGTWGALQFGGVMLPVTGLLLLPWIAMFQHMLVREARQDRRLERTTARAVQDSFRRSALREGERLPDFLKLASKMVGIEKCLLIEKKFTGETGAIFALNSSIDEVAASQPEFAKILANKKGTTSAVPANSLVPQWSDDARLVWLGGANRDLYWLYEVPDAGDERRQSHLIRAVTASFQELLRWRAELNARSRQDERFKSLDEKIKSAIALISQESEQIRRGFDAVETAVMVFHLVGSPLHANEQMEEIYSAAGLSLFDTSLPEAIEALTALEAAQVEDMLKELVRNGGVMRVPLLQTSMGERMLRIAAPQKIARGEERVFVLEAVDVSELHRAADLRQAVAKYIDFQLRNDLEAIFLATSLATDERTPDGQIRTIANSIGDVARRAQQRLDRVADLVRNDIEQISGACYPVDIRDAAQEAISKVTTLAEELAVNLEIELPGASGFTIAEPAGFGTMLEAMLRVAIADTPRGDSVELKIKEIDQRTIVNVTGGFGIGFERLMQLLSDDSPENVGDYKDISIGMAKAVEWDARVSYWGRETEGFGFTIDMRRIG